VHRRAHRADPADRRALSPLFIATQETTMTPSTSNHDFISSDKVEGTNVYNLAGDKLGSVDDLVIDKHSGQVRYAVLEFGGFLGMGTDRYPLPWNMLKYDTAKEGYVVPLDKTKLENAPHYAEDDMPAYTTDYGRRVNGYYGVDF
jgi:sporulation protein YlmC with PRC-barrel domain